MNRVEEKKRLRKVVESFPNVSVMVLGDIVADEFVSGEIARVSREAPVLILKHRESRIVPGGGGNAILNLADLKVNVMPVGVVGDDAAGKALLQIFKSRKIPTSGIAKLKNHQTTTKTRILAYQKNASRQQVVRIDREPEPLEETHPILLELIQSAREYAPAADAMLISDYGYGAATPRLLTFIRAKGTLNGTAVTLDSRYRLTQYAGVTAATPNLPELEAATGMRIDSNVALVKAGQKLMQEMKLESLVVTRGSEGMVAFEGKKKPLEIPIFGSDEVADVTGAGDTVIATFTAALAAGADTENAAIIANLAGGIVVMKRGTATVSYDELMGAIENY